MSDKVKDYLIDSFLWGMFIGGMPYLGYLLGRWT